MKLSFDDEESFKEAVESLCFNNPSSHGDPNAQHQVGTSNSMPLQEYERNEDNIIPSDPITTLRRVGSSSSFSIQPNTGDSEEWGYSICFNPPSNPEFTSATGCSSNVRFQGVQGEGWTLCQIPKNIYFLANYRDYSVTTCTQGQNCILFITSKWGLPWSRQSREKIQTELSHQNKLLLETDCACIPQLPQQRLLKTLIEATMLIIDNSGYIRNWVYHPTRFEALTFYLLFCPWVQLEVVQL